MTSSPTLVLSLLMFVYSQVARWTVGKLTSDRFPSLTGTIILQPIVNGSGVNYNESNVAPVIEMEWRVPSASVSGLAVAGLHLTNERYKPYKGVRTVARSGKFQIRCF